MSKPAVLVGLALALGACAHTEAIDDGLDFDRRHAELTAVAAWNLRGRMTIATPERAYQARLLWRQRGDELELEVTGRLGAGGFRVTGTESNLVLEARGETHLLTDPERQLSELLGWWLPVTSAEHWLLGRPDPDFPARSADGRGTTLDAIAQRDWEIAYDEYQLAEGRLIPRRLTLEDSPLMLVLTITEWESVATEP